MSAAMDYEQGVALAAAGDLGAAEAAFQRALEAQHDHAAAHQALGRLYEKQGRAEDAADCYHCQSFREVHLSSSPFRDR